MDMHGHGGMGGHTAPSPSASAAAGDADPGPMSYFAYGNHTGTIVAHVVLMIVAWFFVLPVGTYPPIGKKMGRGEKETMDMGYRFGIEKR